MEGSPPRSSREVAGKLSDLRSRIESCRACPRLVRYRERVAQEGELRTGLTYWGRPVGGFGDPQARLVIVGLAPAARGANRTGRVFTGDRSAQFLTAALHRAGFANQPTSTARDDGLLLRDAFVTAAVRCAPPDNRPSPAETRRCRPYLAEELALLPRRRVLLALGGFAWDQLRAICSTPSAPGGPAPRLPSFAHGRRIGVDEGRRWLWGCYHPSPRNVQTGLFGEAMFDALLDEVRTVLDTPAPAKG